MTTKTEMNKNKLGGGYTCKACGKYHSTTVRCTCNNTAPESQAHLLTEKHSNDMAHVSEHKSAMEYLKEPSLKELSQPPVMEGKEESIYNLSVSALSTIRTIKDFCNNSGISKMAESAEKDLIKIFDNARDNVDSEKYANQKTAPLQDEIKSLRYDLFHVTANEQSLQSEVEQLKGLLRESKIFCGGSLQARIDNYLSK